jgi:sulfatase modifying factor 1
MSDGTTGNGSVSSVYRISKFEVTVAQYTEFLNAVAASDPNGVYKTLMGSGFFGNITRTGSDGSFDYTAFAGVENMPMSRVAFYDTIRFVNWLDNGQPTGAQDSTTTEDGAYTITAQGIFDNSITRDLGATVFLPSEDEWYKAAYYDALSASYFLYPTETDVQTTCSAPRTTTNTANCGSVVLDWTDVGSYINSGSPSGTFDQGGNVAELNETIMPRPRPARATVAERPTRETMRLPRPGPLQRSARRTGVL